MTLISKLIGMKSFILTIGFLSMNFAIFGQANAIKKNSIFVEFAGSGGLGSVNFERQFYHSDITALNYRIGLSFAPIDRNNGTAIVFPVLLNGLIGRSAHKIELGVGQGLTITTKGNLFALTTACVGYRFQTDTKHWFYRLSYTPLISYLVDFQIQHWAGVSIGYTFFKKE